MTTHVTAVPDITAAAVVTVMTSCSLGLGANSGKPYVPGAGPETRSRTGNGLFYNRDHDDCSANHLMRARMMA
jgi:hypothetical protein